MNEKQEKKRRYNLRLEFIAHFNKWLDSEPAADVAPVVHGGGTEGAQNGND